MKISLKLANGATLEFEGDAAEFERVSEFLAEPPESLTADSPVGHVEPLFATPRSDDQVGAPAGAALSPGDVAERLEKVGAVNDQARVTVMAQMAVEAGLEGVDFETVGNLYTELGFPKPAQFPSKTFSNAKASGLVKAVKPGVWRTTYRGENYARGLGLGPERPTRRSPSRSKNSGNQGGGSN